jgi:hypothetical protein
MKSYGFCIALALGVSGLSQLIAILQKSKKEDAKRNGMMNGIKKNTLRIICALFGLAIIAGGMFILAQNGKYPADPPVPGGDPPGSGGPGYGGGGHMLGDKAKVIEIVSARSILVEIVKDEGFTREDDRTLVNGDIVLAIYDEGNTPARERIEKLSPGSYVHISRTDTTKLNTDVSPIEIDCNGNGITLYDEDWNIIAE